MRRKTTKALDPMIAQDYANGKAADEAHAALLMAACDYAKGTDATLDLQNAAVRFWDATEKDQKHSATLLAARVALRSLRESRALSSTKD